MKFKFDHSSGAFQKNMKAIDRPIGTAARAAVKEALQDALTHSKADVLSSGLGQRWAKSFKTKFYKNDGIGAAGIVYSRINYGVVFERGAEVKGKPKLWIPLHTTPKKIGGKRLTAKVFSQQIGHLFKVKIGGREFLAAKIAVSKKAAAGPLPVMSATMLKNRAKPKPGQRTRLIPMFVAAASITIRKRLNIAGIAQKAAAKLPRFFANAIKGD